MPLEGKQISRYRLVRLLGSGGMGDVYLAEDDRIEQHVAIKIIRAEVSPYSAEKAGEEAARLFRREAKAIAKLDHPYILPLFDFGEEPLGDTTLMYLVMPYRQEGSLASWLHQRANRPLLTPQEVAHIVQQAAAALQHAHTRNVIHQDVKPSNFLIRFREDSYALPDLLLADFGIARFMTATSSASQSIRGTPSYMAPEQWEGEPTPATDQYALAVMAYELLTGRLPFLGGPGKMMYQHIQVAPQPPSHLNPRLPHEIDTVLLQALAKQPEQRFSSITAFANTFRHITDKMQNIQEVRGASSKESEHKNVLPTPFIGIDTTAPTLPASDIYPLGSDSETYVKPKITLPLPTPAPLHPQEEPSSEGDTPNQKKKEAVSQKISSVELPLAIIDAPISKVPMKSTPRKAKRRPLLLAGLLVLVLAVVSAGVVYALPILFGNGIGTLFYGVAMADSASVMITPVSRDLRNTYTISPVTGIPNTSKGQVKARLLSSTTQPQSNTVNATGTVTTPATNATGILTFENYASAQPITFTLGTVISDNPDHPNIQMQLDATIVVPGGAPAAPNPNPSASGPAHVVQVGTIGNIPAGAGGSSFFYGGAVYGTAWGVANSTPFTGGQDPGTYTTVLQSDIDGAAHALIQTNSPNPQQVLQAQIQPNERSVGSPQCKPNVNADHKAGDQTTSVTVTVSFTCTGEVYDQSAALSLAAQLLTNQATTDLGTRYVPKGNIATTLTQAVLTDATKGTISLTVDAEGTWVFQFSEIQKQALAKLIVGKSKQDTIKLLLAQQGIAKATIQFSGGDGNTVPTSISHIIITVL